MSKIRKTLIIVLGVLVAIRIFLPAIILSQLNRVLESKMGSYEGHIGDFDLNLYRGSYQIQNLEIKKRNSQEAPLFFVEEIDLSMAWRALLQKNITLDVTFTSPQINLADSKETEKKQYGTEESKEVWSDVFNVIVPISIETLKIHNGAIAFSNLDIKGNLKVEMTKIELEAKNLRSRARGELSPVRFSADLQKHAPINANGEIDILSVPIQADLDFEIEKFEMSSVNKTLRYYIPLDITKGKLSAYGEAAMSKAKAIGYAKVFFSDGDIIAKNQHYLGLKHFFIEIAAAFGNWFLKNNESKKVAFKVPFSYDGKEFDISASTAFWSAVKNGNAQLKPGIEKTISLDNPAFKNTPSAP